MSARKSFLLLALILSIVSPSLRHLPADEEKSAIGGLGPVGPIVKLHGGFQFTEGPAADAGGNVYFCDIPNERIHKVDTDGKLSVVRAKSRHANGLMFNDKGELVACEMDGSIAVYSADGKSRRVLAGKYNGQRFNAPNDLVIDKHGGVYFTDPAFGAPTPLPQEKTAVYYIAAGGKVTRLIDDLPNPNGIILSPDEKTLYVIPSGQPDMMAYPVEGPGKLGKGRVFCTLRQRRPGGKSGGDGLTIDGKGNLYITSGLGLQVFSPEGKLLGIIQLPEEPANVTFGGKELKTLYVTARTSLYTVPMKVTGHLFARPHRRTPSPNPLPPRGRGKGEGVADAKAILAKAIQAHGGETKLARLKNVWSKATGTVAFGKDVPFTWEIIWQWPDRLKNVIRLENNPPIVETLDGNENWSQENGQTRLLKKEKLDDLRAQAHVRRLLLLTPLLHDNIYDLSSLGEIRLDERPAQGVCVRCAGERDVNLYFDAGTGRLVKIERLVYDEKAKKEVLQEEILSEYQDSDDVPTARKQVWFRNGEKGLHMTLTEVRYPEHLDAGLFADPWLWTRRRDVIYGHKNGVALTMDVFTPKKGANGLALLNLVSGGWFSDQALIDWDRFMSGVNEQVKRGYTVFAVCHGSQPLFTIPDAIADVNHAVRFIRYHAHDFHIDPHRLGVTGGSAGGHLSLMLSVAGDYGNPHALDPLERTSSRVQAVACFFPPTDFLNYGKKGRIAFEQEGVLANYRTAIDVRERDNKTKRLEHIGGRDKVLALYRRVSPLVYVTSAAPPTLIIHGDADNLVPIQQAEVMVAQLKKAGVPAKLVVKKGKAHGWGRMEEDRAVILDWLDKYLHKP